MLLQLAYLTVTNAFAVLRLLPMSDPVALFTRLQVPIDHPPRSQP
ncbi:hypothetical protein AB0N14_02115 [Streptomyces sp. NPDC051104]